MRNYKLYLFDFDDTLIRTYVTATTRYYPQLAELLGVSVPSAAAIRQHWGGELFNSLEKLFGIPISDTQRHETLQRLATLHQESPPPLVDGTARILQILRKHGKGVVIFSASNPLILQTSLRGTLPDPPTCDAIFSLCEQDLAKPSPHIVFAILEQYRHNTGRAVPLSQVLVVGDSVSDFQMARNARVDFAAVLTGPATTNDFALAGLSADCVFPTVKEALTPPDSHGVVAVIKDDADRYLLIQEARPENPYRGCWSGPHGVCDVLDVIEEETVTREAFEEIGVDIRPVRKLYTRSADTKVSTVSFWESQLLTVSNGFKLNTREVGDISWFRLDDILSGTLPLYPGTKDFFNQLNESKGLHHGNHAA